MSTLEPRAPYTPEELKQLYPIGLELQQVQVLLRHGERTPVGARFKNTGLHPYWPYCSVAKAMRTAVMQADGSLDTLQWERKIQTLGQNDLPTLNTGVKGETDGICQAGELTDRGAKQPSHSASAYDDSMSTSCTSYPACLTVHLRQSSHFAPHPSLAPWRVSSKPIPASTRLRVEQLVCLQSPSCPAQCKTKPSSPTKAPCKRFAELARAFADRTAKLYNDGPELAYINNKIGKWMPFTSPVVKVDSHPRLSGVMDTVNASLAHGPDTRLPKEFYDRKVRDDIDKVCVEEWFVGYMESNDYRKLGVGSMVGDLTQRMVEHARAGGKSGEEPPRMSLAGCHDTTIAGTLVALGAMDATKDKWPNFTSNIAFELFKEPSATSSTTATPTGAIWPSTQRTWWSSLFSSYSPAPPTNNARTPLSEFSDSERSDLEGFFVRLRYNDNPVTVPFCKATGRNFEGDATFCTLSAFKEAVDSFTPKDWKAECGANLGKSAMNGVIERPPGL